MPANYIGKKPLFLVFFILNTIILCAGHHSAKAQSNILNRVTSAVRSDGKGKVVRFQLRQKVDSFQVYQPEIDLVQLRMYSAGIDTANIQLPSSSSAFDEISFYEIPGGIGVDVYLKSDTYYEADAYSDGQSNDLLLALTKTAKADLKKLTKGLEPIIWSTLKINADSLLVKDIPLEPASSNDGYEKVSAKAKVDVVVLDPGHGGHDPGASGYKNIKEKNIVLAIAKKVGGYIKKYMPGVKVVYTRDNDTFVGLKERGEIANRNQGDLFVSIHCNSARARQAHGTETWFLGLEKSKVALEVMKRENKVVGANEIKQKELSNEKLLVYEMANSGYITTSERIAGMIEHQFADRAQRRARGVKQARFVVLYHASMPAVLVETGFITNPSEGRYLNSDYGQSIIASAIFRAIRNYKESYDKSQHFSSE